MSTGNTKTQGNKGNNFPFQHKNLRSLGDLISNSANTNSLLSSILVAIRLHQDMEIMLVRDTGNGDQIVQQIREYDEETSTFLPPYYQDVSGAPYVPLGPLEYMDPDAVLNLIYTELVAQGLSLDSLVAALDVALSTRASEATLSSLNTKFATVTRTPSLTRTSGSGTVAAGARRVSFFNSGGVDDATVLGTVLKSNESVTFVAGGEDDTLSVIAYNAGTSELVISTIV